MSEKMWEKAYAFSFDPSSGKCCNTAVFTSGGAKEGEGMVSMIFSP